MSNMKSPFSRRTIESLAESSDRRDREELARRLAKILPRFCTPPEYINYFRLWEDHGFHLTPVHYYQPIPEVKSLPAHLFEEEHPMAGVDMNVDTQLLLLTSIFPQFREEYNKFPRKQTSIPHEFYLDNEMFSGTDALALYCVIRHFKPRRIIEIGGGFSTRMMAQACVRNGNVELVTIDPYPDPILMSGFPGLTRCIPARVQDLDLNMFQELQEGDILFIDSSHVVRCGGDVKHLYLKVLPILRKGVIVHAHDIFFPYEYPRSWVLEQFRFYSEQYLLQAFLMFNSEFEVLLCNSYLGRKHVEELRKVFPLSPWWSYGGSFWMSRGHIEIEKE